MSWHHHIAAFLRHNLPQMRATRRANLALLAAAIRPLLLADRGFGRASLLRWLPEMPRHTGRTVDYECLFKGNAHIWTADGYQGLLRNYPLRPGGAVGGEPGTVLGSGASGTLMSSDFAARCEGGGATISQTDATGAVFSRWQAVFCAGSSWLSAKTKPISSESLHICDSPRLRSGLTLTTHQYATKSSLVGVPRGR